MPRNFPKEMKIPLEQKCHHSLPDKSGMPLSIEGYLKLRYRESIYDDLTLSHFLLNHM